MAASLTRGTACVLALLAAAATAGAQNKRPMTFMDIMELKNVGGVSLSPDGSKVAYTVEQLGASQRAGVHGSDQARHREGRQARHAVAHLDGRRRRRSAAPGHVQRAR